MSKAFPLSSAFTAAVISSLFVVLSACSNEPTGVVVDLPVPDGGVLDLSDPALSAVGGAGYGDSKDPVAIHAADDEKSLLNARASQIAAGISTHACAVVNGGLRCWGANTHGQLGDGTTLQRSTPVPVVLSALATGVAAGDRFTCAIVGDAAWCWGANDYGQLGDASTTSSPRPHAAQLLESGVTSIAAGARHACAVMNGAAYCWGSNAYGQLGDNSTASSTLPRAVSGLTSGVTSIAAGAYHTCAIVNGRARCWGRNSNGQLGVGDTDQRLVPTNVSGLSSGVTALAAGSAHSCAVRNGGVVCWGYNNRGQLGNGSTTQATTFVSAQGVVGATSLATGESHTCTIVGGVPLCWGYNNVGQLGTGNTTQSTTPLALSTIPSGAGAVAAGTGFSCALVIGSVKCWGANTTGALGDGTTQSRLIPTDVGALSTGGVGAGGARVSAGGSGTCAVRAGRAYCWGSNTMLQRGSGTLASATDVYPLPSLTSGASEIATGGSHSCAVVDGALWCWGNNDKGQLGTWASSPTSTPWRAVVAGVSAVALGTDFTCAVVNSQAMCWGGNDNGQLGNGTTASSRSPIAVRREDGTLLTGVTSIAAGAYHACAIAGGAVTCWGNDWMGQLGDGGSSMSTRAKQVVGLTAGATIVSAGMYHSCALVNGAAKCWGYGSNGQLGDGLAALSRVPVQVIGFSSGVTTVAAGLAHTCVLRDSAVHCFGANNQGQLGDGMTSDRALPAQVPGVFGVATISAGTYHTCAADGDDVLCWGGNADRQVNQDAAAIHLQPQQVRLIRRGSSTVSLGVNGVALGGDHGCAVSGNAVRCWGANSEGQLGNGTTTPSVLPTAAVSGATIVAAGGDFGAHVASEGGRDDFSCSADDRGAVSCWGGNTLGQLGTGDTTWSNVPRRLATLTNGATALSAGRSHACVLVNGAAWCWGDNSWGQLGDGTTTTRTAPIAVVGLSSGVTAISCGDAHTCAVVNGAAKCWGLYSAGALGTTSATTPCYPLRCALSPVPVSSMASGVTSIAAGSNHSCAIQNGAAICWGQADFGQLATAANLVDDGYGSYAPTPVPVVGLTAGATMITAGRNHTCALVNGQLWCWGSNNYGQLSGALYIHGTEYLFDNVPVLVPLTGEVLKIDAADDSTCATVIDETVEAYPRAFCWGENASGELGYAQTCDLDPDAASCLSREPVMVQGL